MIRADSMNVKVEGMVMIQVSALVDWIRYSKREKVLR